MYITMSTCTSYALNVLRDVTFKEGFVTMLVRIQIGQKKHFSQNCTITCTYMYVQMHIIIELTLKAMVS